MYQSSDPSSAPSTNSNLPSEPEIESSVSSPLPEETHAHDGPSTPPHDAKESDEAELPYCSNEQDCDTDCMMTCTTFEHWYTVVTCFVSDAGMLRTWQAEDDRISPFNALQPEQNNDSDVEIHTDSSDSNEITASHNCEDGGETKATSAGASNNEVNDN